jgi:MinD superfamily P-loop ATPase
MQIAVASGKGGTGKTTIATSLAVALAQEGRSVAYLDCDVEEPNGRIFLQPQLSERQVASVQVPRLVDSKCNYCGICSESCEFNALTVLKDSVLIYDELCHGCGGCALVCPEKAIEEVARPVGAVNAGTGRGVRFVEGCLNVGEVQAPVVIREVRKHAGLTDVVVVDAPPGTSCAVIESVTDCGYVILVTEPTPFGLHDLRLAVSMLQLLKLPHGVIVNRDDGDNREVLKFCNSSGVEILARIPFDRAIAEAYSRGELLTECHADYQAMLVDVFARIEKRAAA